MPSSCARSMIERAEAGAHPAAPRAKETVAGVRCECERRGVGAAGGACGALCTSRRQWEASFDAAWRLSRPAFNSSANVCTHNKHTHKKSGRPRLLATLDKPSGQHARHERHAGPAPLPPGGARRHRAAAAGPPAAGRARSNRRGARRCARQVGRRRQRGRGDAGAQRGAGGHGQGPGAPLPGLRAAERAPGEREDGDFGVLSPNCSLAGSARAPLECAA